MAWLRLVPRRALRAPPRAQVLNVAESYGLKNVTHYEDYATMHATINPFRQAQKSGTSHTAVANSSVASLASADVQDKDPFAAILVMCDPYAWFEALQVCVDVLCSPTPIQLEFDPAAPYMPVHFSNPDVLWKTQHPYTARPPPRLLSTAHVRIRFRQAHLNSSSAALCHCSWARFGQGAFKIALRALYATKLRHLRVPEETHDERIASSFKQWGKPTDSTFRFLEARLRSLAPDSAQQPKAERFYMIGDNPASDMEGVRRANIFHRTAALPEALRVGRGA